MSNPFEGQRNEKMAPPDLAWHYEYEVTMNKVSELIDGLMAVPGYKEAEDLGDWTEMLSTLISFRPRTRKDIVERAQQDCRKQ